MQKVKVLEFIDNASPAIQFMLFCGIVISASLVTYFQNSKKEVSWKQHILDYLKVFISGVLAFTFTLLLSGEFGWSLYWTCLVGGVNVMFSKKFFDKLYDMVTGKTK